MFSNVSDFLVSLTRSLSEYQLRFKERTTTDYAILEDSIVYDLDAATVCFFALIFAKRISMRVQLRRF